MELPEWFSEFRPHQTVAIAQIISAFKTHDVVMLDAPTGSGKTLIAEAVRQIRQQQAIYVCVTKTLQDQFLGDYDYARVLKGRSNYPTELDEFSVGLTADDCTGNSCKFCPSACPYKVAKANAVSAPVSVLNLSYVLREFQTEGSSFKHYGLKILDECDRIEDILLGNASVTISDRSARKLRISPPEKKTVAESWLQWAEETEIILEEYVYNLGRVYGSHKEAVRRRRWNRYVRGLYDKVHEIANDLQRGLEEGEDTWIYTGYDEGKIEFKPITVGKFGEKLLWKHGGKWLLMSGTIISPAVLANDIGLGDIGYKVVQVDYSFDADRRPVYLQPVGSMKRGSIEATKPKLKEKVVGIVKDNPSERILIHTHSYQLAREIYAALASGNNLSRRTITYNSASEREKALSDYKSTEASVLVASSMDRGIDLPGELCRVQIICKAPFPYLGDKQVNARTYGTSGGSLWYSVQTARSIVQMTGRGMRSAEDNVVTYILDDDVRRLIRQRRNLFPDWWLEALRI